MKTVAIIQARMGSSRLPGKMLMTLAGVPVIRQVYDRTCDIPGLDAVWIATTVASSDDRLAAYCEDNEIPVFRGSEHDVLDRYYQIAVRIDAGIVMRITGDCPMLDPVESAKVLELFLQTPECDYASNVIVPFLPDGLDTEVVRMETLERVWKQVRDPVAREHVTWYVHQNPSLFCLAGLARDSDLSDHRWTLDNPEDYELLSRLAEEVRNRGQYGYLCEILQILKDNPSWLTLNHDIRRNEGLLQSREQNMERGG